MAVEHDKIKSNLKVKNLNKVLRLNSFSISEMLRLLIFAENPLCYFNIKACFLRTRNTNFERNPILE